MKNLLLLFCLCAFCCSKDETKPAVEADFIGFKLKNKEYFVFGTFYNECSGEACVEMFKITPTSLLEDVLDKYPSRSSLFSGEYLTQLNEKFEVIKEMPMLPSDLFSSPDHVFGCPDCSDGGGLYIELFKDDKVEYCYIDLQNIKEDHKIFVDAIRRKIQSLQ
jgi:hypothetical protein